MDTCSYFIVRQKRDVLGTLNNSIGSAQVLSCPPCSSAFDWPGFPQTFLYNLHFVAYVQHLPSAASHYVAIGSMML